MLNYPLSSGNVLEALGDGMPNMNWRTGEQVSGVVGQSLGGCAEGMVMYAIHRLRTDGGEAMVIMHRYGPLAEGTRITAAIGTARMTRNSTQSANDDHVIEIVGVKIQPSAAVLPLCRPGKGPELRT